MIYQVYFERFSPNSKTDASCHEFDLEAATDEEIRMKAEERITELALGHEVYYRRVSQGDRIVYDGENASGTVGSRMS